MNDISSIIDHIKLDRARVRAFVLEHCATNRGAVLSCLDSYGTGKGEDDIARISGKEQQKAMEDFLVDFAAWRGSAPVRSALYAVCGEDVAETAGELKRSLASRVKRNNFYTNALISAICYALLFPFNDIPFLNKENIRAVIDALSMQKVAKALKTEPHGMLNKFCSAMTVQEAQELKKTMEDIGQVRMRDVLVARNEISRTIRSLIEQGKVKVSDMPHVAESVAQNANGEEGIGNDAVFSEVIEGAVVLRTAVRNFVLQKAQDRNIDVSGMLDEYDEETVRRASAYMWHERYVALLDEIYIAAMQADGKMRHFMRYVPRAAIQKFLDGDAAQKPDMRRAIRESVLMWSDVPRVSSTAAERILEKCSMRTVAQSLVGSDSEAKKAVLRNLDGEIAENADIETDVTCQTWGKIQTLREIEKMIDALSCSPSPNEINEARDKVLDVLADCGGA